MLPVRRVWSTILLGLGAALLTVGLLLPRWVHTEPQLGLDFGEATWTLHDDSAELGAPGREPERVGLTRQLHLRVEKPVDEHTVTARIGTALLRDSGEGQPGELDRLLSARLWNLPMERATGAGAAPAVVSDQIVGPIDEVEVAVPWLKLPSGTPADGLEIFDDTLRVPLPAEYVGEEELQGVTVRHYRQRIEPAEIAETTDPRAVATLPEGGELRLRHSGTRDYWVEPASGLPVRIEEDIRDFFADDAGRERAVALDFHGVMTDDQVTELLERAAGMRPAGVWTWGPWLLAGIGAVLLLLGLFGAFGPERRDGEDETPRGGSRRV